MSYTERDRLIALAGIFQAAFCTQQIARRGVTDGAAVEASVYSLFQMEAENVEAVFGQGSGVTTGMRKLVSQLQGNSGRDMELTRYVISLIQLERKLSSLPAVMARIGTEIQTIRSRLDHFHLLHGNILAQLAELYSQTVSQIQPRIMVRGEALYLRNPDNANKIRTLLLAGIRAARLWRQTGGRRRQILFGRQRLAREALRILE